MAVPRKIKIVSAFAALYLIWGSTYLGIFFAIQSIPPFLMAGARFLLAGLIMFAIARTQGPLRSTWAEWRTSLIVGACLLLGGNGGVTLSEKFIETGLASLIVATVPIYIILLGWLFGMTPRPGGIVWLGLAGGFLGRRNFARPGVAIFQRDSYSSGHRDVDLAGRIFPLVGRIALFADSEACCVATFRGRSANVLRRSAFSDRRIVCR